MTSAREIRSAITPPHSMKTTIGMVRAASTCPIALAESLTSRIANANATPAIIEPDMLTNCDPKNHAKFRSRSGAKACRTARLPIRPGRPPCSQIGPIDRYALSSY